jgi:hypothetical protein
MNRMIGFVSLVVIAQWSFLSPVSVLAQEREVCAEAVFMPALSQPFSPGNPGTILPFKVNLGLSFSSISVVTATSNYDPLDPFGPDGSYFIFNFGGQDQIIGTSTSKTLSQIDPSVTSEFLDGIFNGTYVDFGFTTFPPNPTDYFTLTSLKFCVTGISRIILVRLDIKPGSFPNSINPRNRGVVPVAILTTDTFDTTTVDPMSVKFGPNGAVESNSSLEDVNGDGRLDLVLKFSTQATGIKCGDTSASVTGTTIDGQVIKGADSINTVGCK